MEHSYIQLKFIFINYGDNFMVNNEFGDDVVQDEPKIMLKIQERF